MIPKLDSQTLINLIAAYRVLSIQKEQALQAMEELARRRQAGDLLDYETQIEAQVQEILQAEMAERIKIGNL